MVGKVERQEELLVYCSLGELLGQDHILRRVDAVLDLSWVAAEVEHLYSERVGRPSVPPETVVRLFLVGFLLGIPSIRRLCYWAQTDLGIRWFCGLGLGGRAPDHSTLSKILSRWGPEVFERLFERTVGQCVAAGLVGGETVHVDATLIDADVSVRSLTRAYVEEAQAVVEAEEDDEDDGRPPPVRFAEGGEEMPRQRKKRSRTDPDATQATQSKGQPLRMSYQQSQAVDSRCQVVLGVWVTTGERGERKGLVKRLAEVERRTGRRMTRLTADAGYSGGEVYAALEALGIEAVIPPQATGAGRGRSDGGRTSLPKRRFRYDAVHDVVRCPRGAKLVPKSVDKLGRGVWYRSCRETCSGCPLFEQCVPPTSRYRSVLIGPGYPALLRARRRRARGWSAQWEAATRCHRSGVEGVHGEAKTQHGLRRARWRGLWKVRVQSHLTAAVLNLKRLAGHGVSLRRGLVWLVGELRDGLWGSWRSDRPWRRGRWPWRVRGRASAGTG